MELLLEPLATGAFLAVVFALSAWAGDRWCNKW